MKRKARECWVWWHRWGSVCQRSLGSSDEIRKPNWNPHKDAKEGSWVLMREVVRAKRGKRRAKPRRAKR